MDNTQKVIRKLLLGTVPERAPRMAYALLKLGSSLDRKEFETVKLLKLYNSTLLCFLKFYLLDNEESFKAYQQQLGEFLMELKLQLDIVATSTEEDV